jgi:DNA-binding NarL/FixJ family response regulator
MKPSPSQRKIRILVAEDHVLMRAGLVAAANHEPDLEVVAEVADGRLLLHAFRQQPVDVVVLDWRMRGMDGVEIIKVLRAEAGAAPILILNRHGDGGDIARAMQAGAAGYLVKGMALEHILMGIRTVHAGERYLPHEMASQLEEWTNSGSVGEKIKRDTKSDKERSNSDRGWKGFLRK